MNDVVLNNRSDPLTAGLVNDSINNAWTSTAPLPGVPTGDGVWPLGNSGATAAQRVLFLPVAGAPQASFSLRVYAWRSIGGPDLNANVAVSLPLLLAEFACVSSNVPGPRPVGVPSLMRGDMYACDTIALTQGVLGQTGEIVSTGPASDLIAFALLEMRGARFFSFDFQQTDAVPMNCFWARA